MKKKLNISNPLVESELLQENILKKESNQYKKFKRYIIDKNYGKDLFYKTIHKMLKYNVGKSWNDVCKKLCNKIPQEYHYKIYNAVWYKNRNGQFVNRFGEPQILLDTVRSTARFWERYYIENDIIKLYKPYVKFNFGKNYKVIKKKVKPVEKKYLVNFDYDIIDHGNYNVENFIKILESNKKTYRVRKFSTVYSSSLKYDRVTRRFGYEPRTELIITHIKTSYD